MAMFFILVLFVCSCTPTSALSDILIPSYDSFSKIQLPPGLAGAESVGLDPQGHGPYITVADGRILKWLGPDFGFMDFATTSANRTKELCDGTVGTDLIFTCGRPIGFSFNMRTGDLYIVDAVLRLFVVGPNGGLAKLLANTAEGITFKFLNGVDVHPITEDVYFTSSSTKFDIRNITQPEFLQDSSGRFLRYNPRTEQVTVLLRGLPIAIGPAVSLDGTFVVFSELGKKRIVMYWILGLKANTVEVLLNVPGYPNKVKRTQIGDFWVPVNEFTAEEQYFVTPKGYRFNEFAQVVDVMDFSPFYSGQNITVLNEQNGALRVGCRTVNFIGIYT